MLLEQGNRHVLQRFQRERFTENLLASCTPRKPMSCAGAIRRDHQNRHLV
jgi:hypothetical protein